MPRVSKKMNTEVACLKKKDQYHFLNPLPDDKILDWSHLKQIADDTLKCI